MNRQLSAREAAAQYTMMRAHTLAVAILNLGPVHPDDVVGRAARHYAKRVRALVTDGVTDYGRYEVQAAFTVAIERLFGIERPKPTNLATVLDRIETQQREARIAELTGDPGAPGERPALVDARGNPLA